MTSRGQPHPDVPQARPAHGARTPALVALALSLSDYPLGARLPRGLGPVATGIYLLHPGLILIANHLSLPSGTARTAGIFLLCALMAAALSRTRAARLLF